MLWRAINKHAYGTWTAIIGLRISECPASGSMNETFLLLIMVSLLYVIEFQVLLGLSGVLLVMLSVLGSVGFFSAIGVKSTLIIMEVIPFLVLAVSSLL